MFNYKTTENYYNDEIYQSKQKPLITEDQLELKRTPCSFCHKPTNRTYKQNNTLISACKKCASHYNNTQKNKLTISLIFK